MKAYLVFMGTGPILVLTAQDSILSPAALAKLKEKGIARFFAFALPLDSVKEKYYDHYEHVITDLKETDDLRVLDADGEHAFGRFKLTELGPPIFYEPSSLPSRAA